MALVIVTGGSTGAPNGTLVSASNRLTFTAINTPIDAHIRTESNESEDTTFTLPAELEVSYDGGSTWYGSAANPSDAPNIGPVNVPIKLRQVTNATLGEGETPDGNGRIVRTFTTDGSYALTTPPSQVTGLAAGTPTISTVPLTWNAATDNVGVTAYRVKRATNSGMSANLTTLADNIATTSYSAARDSAMTGYWYTVSARDAAGNWGTESATVSVPAAIFVDTFDRADSTSLGASWTEHTNSNIEPEMPPPNWAISNNRLVAPITYAGFGAKCTASGMADTADQIVEVTIVQEVTATSARGGIVGRHGGGTDDAPVITTQDYYLAQIHGSGRVYLQKTVNGAVSAFTSIAAGSGYTLQGSAPSQYVSWTPQAGDRLRLSCIGTAVKVYGKHPAGSWELLIDAVDNEADKITTGKAGVWTLAPAGTTPTATFDAFYVY